MPATLRKLLKSVDGATAIEYGLIAALIAVGALAGFQSFGAGLSNMWDRVSNEVGSTS
jgi:pilus assembly protein Flp/PilA